MLTEKELAESPLFEGIGYDGYLAMVHCFHARQRSFLPDETIDDFSEPGDGYVGIVEHGQAALIRMDSRGTVTVLEELPPGSVFGKTLAFSGNSGDSLWVTCRRSCDVLFFEYPHLLKRCERACTHHSLLVQNMLRLMGEKAQSLSERVDVLSRRTIRDKLLCYFAQQAKKRNSPDFELPFSLSLLADYIAADRSAMMRELKRLREEGQIETQGRHIILVS